VLRSLFELDIDEKKSKEVTGQKSLDAINFIIQKTKESNPEVSLFSDFELNIELLESLKNEIFGNQEGEGKDVFYDAWIDISKTPTNKFLAKDFITPHTNPLKNPTPLQFLKVLPRIGFNFQFSLNDGILNSTQKELLFKKILLTIGIGAKTNVGYGQFTETTVSTGEIIPQIIEEEKSNITDEIIHPSIEAIALINPEIRYKGKIVFQKKDNFILEFSIIEGEIIRLKKKGKSFKIGTPEKGKSVSLKFNIPYNKEEPIFTATLDE
jgi:CRISPR type III-B/RAMP module RAMP protein Cmr6